MNWIDSVKYYQAMVNLFYTSVDVINWILSIKIESIGNVVRPHDLIFLKEC